MNAATNLFVQPLFQKARVDGIVVHAVAHRIRGSEDEDPENLGRFLEADFRGPVSQAVGVKARTVPADVEIAPEPPKEVRGLGIDQSRRAERDPTGGGA